MSYRTIGWVKMEVTYKAIGIMNCIQSSPTDSPRQGNLAVQSQGFIRWTEALPPECFSDFKSFDRIWLIYDFHFNKSWKPMVRPPRGGDKKRGVLATRSPYRPNSIGMSCVLSGPLTSEGLEVFQHDLLDGTPILDIKPYLSYCDSFPEASLGWLEGLKAYVVNFSEDCSIKIAWLSEHLEKPLTEILKNQLEFDPMNSKSKRVKKVGNNFVFSYKTWRFDFSIDQAKVEVFRVRSGYSQQELFTNEDPYGDKRLHRFFLKTF